MSMTAPELSLMKKREDNRPRIDPLAKRKSSIDRTEHTPETVEETKQTSEAILTKQNPRSRGNSFVIHNIKHNSGIDHIGGFDAATVDSLVHAAIKDKNKSRRNSEIA